MTLSEARERARALIIQGIDDPARASMLQDDIDELNKFIEELDAQRRAEPSRGHNLLDPAKHHMRYDITVSDESWRRLMCGVWLVWRVAMDDHEMRYDPDKPKKRLEDNWEPDGPDYDYGEDAGVEFDDYVFVDPKTGEECHGWDAWWREVFHAPPGRRWAAPSLGPLYEVYLLLRDWWTQYTGKKGFRPHYDTDRNTTRVSPDSEHFNAAGRLFLKVAQALDARYTATNCASVYEMWRNRAK